MAANWRVYSNADVTAAFSQDTNNPHSGASSQKISVQLGEFRESARAETESRCAPGRHLHHDSLVARRPGHEGELGSYATAFPFTSATTLAITAVELTSNWKQVSTPLVVPAANVGLATIEVHVMSPGTVWVDDVSLTDASGQPVSGGMPWPAAGFGTLRLWNLEGTRWAALEPAKGQWNWGPLDYVVAAAQQHGVSDILLTLGQTPGWASSSPDNVSGSNAYYGAGRAGAAGRYPGLARLRYRSGATLQRPHSLLRNLERAERWRDWTTPAPPAQLVALTQEAYKILKAVDPGNTVVSPCPFTNPDYFPYSLPYLDQLLAAGVGNYVDMLAYHVYTFTDPPESRRPRTSPNVRLVMAKYGLAKMPLWDTEGASGDTTTPLDRRAQMDLRGAT